jgi:hypothetical protein
VGGGEGAAPRRTVFVFFYELEMHGCLPDFKLLCGLELLFISGEKLSISLTERPGKSNSPFIFGGVSDKRLEPWARRRTNY